MNKKVNTIVLLSFLSILVLCTSYAYSKYKTNVMGEAIVDVAKWNISVNECNIVNSNSEIDNCFVNEVDEETGVVNVKRNYGIKDIEYSNNGSSTIVANKIGPGSKGYFKIKIKPNDTEVSIKYKLKAWLTQENYSIKLYRSDPNSDNKVELEKDGYEGLIKYSPTNKNYEEIIIIYVDWENDSSGANDKFDTQIGTSGSAPILEVPVLIEFEQYKG